MSNDPPFKRGDRVRVKKEIRDKHYPDVPQVLRVEGVRWIPGHWNVWTTSDRPDCWTSDCLEIIETADG